MEGREVGTATGEEKKDGGEYGRANCEERSEVMRATGRERWVGDRNKEGEAGGQQVKMEGLEGGKGVVGLIR